MTLINRTQLIQMMMMMVVMMMRMINYTGETDELIMTVKTARDVMTGRQD